MEDEAGKLKSYLDRIDRLQESQKAISDELLEIKKQIRAEWYKKAISKDSVSHPLIEDFVPIEESVVEEDIPEKYIVSIQKKYQETISAKVPKEIIENDDVETESEEGSDVASNPIFDWEKFVGENLISKLGVLIILIGVVIGAKYSIENDLINPTTRIALGYLVGLLLLGAGMWSKAKYINYSAVLVSGAMAIMFFITFFAYSFYSLIAMEVAFGLMVLFTIFTVIAAIKYDRQVIAIIGLVGAYAVPFLLSNDSGAYEIFFSYITLVNVGILFIAFRRDWKYLYYISFTLTWLVYLSWFGINAGEPSNFKIAFLFLSVFFVLFYNLILAYKIFKNDKIDIGEVVFLLVNAVIFFLAGYILLDHNGLDSYHGLFTLSNGIIHFLVALFVFKKVDGKSNLFYLLATLVLIFITITIPVQLEGNVVPILWVVEAALLFWVGRTKQVKMIEYFSYPIMALAIMSVLRSWSETYLSYGIRYNSSGRISDYDLTPLFNTYFLTSIISVLGFGWIWKINKDTYKENRKILGYPLSDILSMLFAFITGFFTYMAFKNEIALYWDLKAQAIRYLMQSVDHSNELYDYSRDLWKFKSLWLMIYTMLFLAGISWLMIHKVKHTNLGRVNIVVNGMMILLFLISGLYSLSILRMHYLDPEGLLQGYMSVSIRYIGIMSAAVLMYMTYRFQQQTFIQINLKKYFSLFFHVCLLWIVTSEFFHWADMFGMDGNYKLSLSVLWGIYSVVLVSYGIWKSRKHLRIMAIVLFAITLLKLFVYDIAHLNTISKTIVFVSLGVLLLIISFLYNKYTSRINDEN